MIYALLITNNWTGSKYIYPVTYTTFDEANTAPIPQRHGGIKTAFGTIYHNKIEVIECTVTTSTGLLIKNQ